MNNQESKLSLKSTAEVLGVSVATVRNWIRHDYLTPQNGDEELFFNYKEVTNLKEDIEIGKIVRLNKRANKRNSDKKFIPKEYSGDNNIDIDIDLISSFVTINYLSINEAIFLLSINLLQREKFIYNSSLDDILTFNKKIFKNEYVNKILEDFYKSIHNFSRDKLYEELLEKEIPSHNDILGLIYQSLKSEGEKAKQGSYYTPKDIVADIIEDYVKDDQRVLDPCCGTGQFLLIASDSISNPRNLFGFDIDPIAVFIAKINLIMKYKKIDFYPNISCKDTLLDFDSSTLFSTEDQFDLILTNPPWGLHFENETLNSLKSLYPHIKSLESFSYFLSKSIEMLSDGGILSFILPESILNIKVHSDIRNTILKNTSIRKIKKLGRAFTKVFTNVIRIDLSKINPEENHKLEIISDSSYTILQNRFLSNSDHIFDIDVNDYDNSIIEKVFAQPFATLKNNAEWALGIVTGDNKKFLHTTRGEGLEEIYKGKDVNKYFLSTPSNFIKFEPSKFQQVAPEAKYRASEKLIYKFISNKLVFAYDDQQKLTLNSANILIPQMANYPTKVVLSLLNSSLYQFIYLKKFNTIKVLRGNIEELPFPLFSEVKNTEIVNLVNQVLAKEIDPNIIDSYVFELFGITSTEIKHIKNSI